MSYRKFQKVYRKNRDGSESAGMIWDIQPNRVVVQLNDGSRETFCICYGSTWIPW